MTGAVIEIDASDLKEINSLLKRAKASIGDEGLWDSIGAVGESVTRERLEGAAAGFGVQANVGPFGEAWPAWSEKYARRRASEQGESPPRFLHTLADNLARGISSDAGDGWATWGVGDDVKYAATHQYGDPSRNIPARPFVGFGPAEEKAIEEELTTAIKEAFSAN